MTVPSDESARAAGHWERSAEQSAVGGSLSDLNIKFNEQLRLEETPTDTGNAFRFARLLGDRLRYSTAEEHWLVWDGTRLRRDDGGEAFDLGREVCEEVRRHAAEVPEDQRDEWRRWAKTSESHARREAMLRVAATLPSVRVRGEDLDARPLLLNAPNGTVDLSTLEVRPPSIADLQTRCLSVPFDPAVRTSPLLEDYVATFVPEPEYWHYLTQVLGSSLRGGNDFRLWLIMHGPSTTGKTQLVETIHKILGDYMTPVNTSVFRANMDDRPRPDLMRVLPARLAYAEEGSSSWELHGDHLKRMTGGDPLVARGMRSNVMVERVPAFTPMIV